MVSLSTRGCSSELATLLIMLACSIADNTMSPGLLDVLNWDDPYRVDDNGKNNIEVLTFHSIYIFSNSITNTYTYTDC